MMSPPYNIYRKILSHERKICNENGNFVNDGFEEKSLEECQALGVNDSMIHVDFMIGAPDLKITGYKDGVAYPIFKEGNWAF